MFTWVLRNLYVFRVEFSWGFLSVFLGVKRWFSVSDIHLYKGFWIFTVNHICFYKLLIFYRCFSCRSLLVICRVWCFCLLYFFLKTSLESNETKYLKLWSTIHKIGKHHKTQFQSQNHVKRADRRGTRRNCLYTWDGDWQDRQGGARSSRWWTGNGSSEFWQLIQKNVSEQEIRMTTNKFDPRFKPARKPSSLRRWARLARWRTWGSPDSPWCSQASAPCTWGSPHAWTLGLDLHIGESSSAKGTLAKCLDASS